MCGKKHKWGSKIPVFVQPFAYKKICQECGAVCFEASGGSEKIISGSDNSKEKLSLPITVDAIPENY